MGGITQCHACQVYTGSLKDEKDEMDDKKMMRRRNKKD